MLQTQKIKYEDGNIVLEGYLAIDTQYSGKRPGVLVFHDWSGRNEFADKKAEKLASMGYVGFAVDMYGEGKQGKTTEEKQALLMPILNDRAALRERTLAGLKTLKAIPEVNTDLLGAIGFCFGGLCALDFARSGADVKGVVSFHGLLNKPEHLPEKKIVAKILALHGFEDPLVPPEQVLAFEKEMTDADVDWQLYTYGRTKHAFTNPLAHDTSLGLIYNEIAEKRSMIAMANFFSEIFK
jgi:dienelactone hydrolase